MSAAFAPIIARFMPIRHFNFLSYASHELPVSPPLNIVSRALVFCFPYQGREQMAAANVIEHTKRSPNREWLCAIPRSASTI